MPHYVRISREHNGEIIEGTYLKAFIRNGDTYFLTEIKIYRDGIIDCWELVDFEGLR